MNSLEGAILFSKLVLFIYLVGEVDLDIKHKLRIKICRIQGDLSEDVLPFPGLLRDFLEHLRRKQNLKTQDKVQDSDSN